MLRCQSPVPALEDGAPCCTACKSSENQREETAVQTADIHLPPVLGLLFKSELLSVNVI